MLGEIQAMNKVYISRTELGKGGKLFELIFQKLEADQLFPYLSTLMQELAELLKDDMLQRNYLFQCFKQLTRLRETFEKEEQFSVDREFFIRLFRQVFQEVKLPFEGEPLRGL
ncbi:MAG TPA: helicase I, partial [Algoriphagus sp.]|nr:helicase I [Algoriphagus sp.]